MTFIKDYDPVLKDYLTIIRAIADQDLPDHSLSHEFIDRTFGPLSQKFPDIHIIYYGGLLNSIAWINKTISHIFLKKLLLTVEVENNTIDLLNCLTTSKDNLPKKLINFTETDDSIEHKNALDELALEILEKMGPDNLIREVTKFKTVDELIFSLNVLNRFNFGITNWETYWKTFIEHFEVKLFLGLISGENSLLTITELIGLVGRMHEVYAIRILKAVPNNQWKRIFKRNIRLREIKISFENICGIQHRYSLIQEKEESLPLSLLEEFVSRIKGKDLTRNLRKEHRINRYYSASILEYIRKVDPEYANKI
ncbi:MAG: hypothetical protein ACW98I_18380 [Candidatus Hodarchaeales archaeon]|jgi:hypothetical protein